MREHFERLFAHAWWADRKVLRLLNESPGARQRPIVRLFAHLLAAERVWLLRIRGEDGGQQQVWPELTLVELNALAAANAHGYTRLLAGLDEEGLAAEVAYTNSRRVPFRTSVADILSHVALHGSYHRGQIAAAVRASGAEPANTDFITFVREETPHEAAYVETGAPLQPSHAERRNAEQGPGALLGRGRHRLDRAEPA